MNFKHTVIFFLFILFTLSCSSGKLIYKIPENINDGIEPGSLRDAGVDSSLIFQMTEDINDNKFINIHSVLINYKGRLVYEQYFNGFTKDETHELRSAAKSIGSALTGIAIDKGLIKNVNIRLLDFFAYYPFIKNYDKRKDKITIKNLLTMTAGFECGNIMDNMNSCGAQMYNHPDPIKYILDLPMKDEPGEVFNYNDGTPTVLMAMIGIVAAKPVGEFQNEFLYKPLGIKQDPQTLGISSRDMMKFGLLYLNKGRWNNKQIISEKWVEESTQISYKFDNPYNDGYGYFWWIRTFEVEGIKYKTFYAAGNGGQYIFVFPEIDLVVVLTGGNYNDYGLQNSFEIRIQPFKIVADYILPSLFNN